MKHVTTFVDGMKLPQFENNTKLLENLISKATSQLKVVRFSMKFFYEKTIGMFDKMVENNTIIVIFLKKPMLY
jgi:hypothetical protein